jgi:UDP-N-acetylmuramyl pentapeptide synthase
LQGRKVKKSWCWGIWENWATKEDAAEKFGSGARHFRKMEDLLADIETLPGPEVTLLIKGSRFMQMERVVKRLESGL